MVELMVEELKLRLSGNQEEIKTTSIKRNSYLDKLKSLLETKEILTIS
jgi:hypothetical protein